MIRSQIYLTETERKHLQILARETGKSQSEIIREAIDQLITNRTKIKTNKLAALQQAKGLWNNRDDLSDLAKLRKELDRDFPKE